MNKQAAIAFAIHSAQVGVDQQQVEDYRENVRDTLNDEGAAEWDAVADAAFMAEVARLTKPTTELGQGFQIAAIADGRIVETLYWRAPSGECFTTGERRFDLVNFDKPGQVWHRVGYQLDDAELEFIGNYPRPYGCKLSA